MIQNIIQLMKKLRSQSFFKKSIKNIIFNVELEIPRIEVF